MQTDILEYEMNPNVLGILLKDRTSKHNILWLTDTYGFPQDSEILFSQVKSGDLIKPRVMKSQTDQKSRTKEKAEVFTPLPIIKKMNDQVDSNFSGTDLDYIKRTVLEVTCGEAPYLVSRYDVSTGEFLPLEKREGLLDRKLKRIKDNWLEQAEIALKSVYGYEWQGDSLLLARQNILYTMNDYYKYRFWDDMPFEYWIKFADIISYNIIQMDGVTMCIPTTNTPAKIMNWDDNKFERFDGKREEYGLW